MKEIPGSVKNQGNKGLFLFFIFIFYIMYLLLKVQESGWSASYGEKTYKAMQWLASPCHRTNKYPPPNECN